MTTLAEAHVQSQNTIGTAVVDSIARVKQNVDGLPLLDNRLNGSLPAIATTALVAFFNQEPTTRR